MALTDCVFFVEGTWDFTCCTAVFKLCNTDDIKTKFEVILKMDYIWCKLVFRPKCPYPNYSNLNLNQICVKEKNN